MTNNDVLRRIRYIFNYSDDQMIGVFAHADTQVTRDQVCNWLKPDEDAELAPCDDKTLATFLNGLINTKRGRRDGPPPVPEQRLTHNMILMKLRIALDLKSDEALAILQSAGMTLSNHELSALFRKPGHQQYRECKDQILRNFLKGLQLKFRANSADEQHDEDN
jgi:uncharacterized protein YehS (DUF1456 family)